MDGECVGVDAGDPVGDAIDELDAAGVGVVGEEYDGGQDEVDCGYRKREYADVACVSEQQRNHKRARQWQEDRRG